MSNCRDSGTACGAWAGAGFCDNQTYASYMLTECCASCRGSLSAYIKDKKEIPKMKKAPEEYIKLMKYELETKK